MFAIRSARHDQLTQKNEELGNLREEVARLRADAVKARAIADAQAARANAADDECGLAIETLSRTIADAQAQKSALLAEIDAANTAAAQSAARTDALTGVLSQIGLLTNTTPVMPSVEVEDIVSDPAVAVMLDHEAVADAGDVDQVAGA